MAQKGKAWMGARRGDIHVTTGRRRQEPAEERREDLRESGWARRRRLDTCEKGVRKRVGRVTPG